MIKKKFKRGIAMIELIFAIVIIGIVLLSSPMLIQQSINSSFVAMQQEAIAATASQIATLLSKPWDEQDASNVANAAPILTLSNGEASPLRGLMGQDSLNTRRISRLADATIAPSVMGIDSGEVQATFDDIDDYDGVTMGITVFNAENTDATVGEYVDVNLSINNRITYASDKPNGNIAWGGADGGIVNAGNTIFDNQNNLPPIGGLPAESQIKFVQVNLTSTNPSGTDELVKNITLNAFSCNIGTYPMGDDEGDN